MRSLFLGAALALLPTACEYEVTPDIPDASGPFTGDIALIWAPTSWAVTANFTEAQDAGCAGTQVGSCCAQSQPQLDLSQGGAEPLTVSAGTIALHDGAALLGAFGFQGIGYVPLSSAETPSLTWAPGDALTVSADGGLVDPLSGSIVAPAAFAGVTPALSLTGQIVIPLSQDFRATWTPPAPDTGDTVTLSLFDPSGFYIDCTVPDDAGAIVAPASLLASFVSGDSGYVTLSRATSATLSSANASVTLTAEATDPGLAHFQ